MQGLLREMVLLTRDFLRTALQVRCEHAEALRITEEAGDILAEADRMGRAVGAGAPLRHHCNALMHAIRLTGWVRSPDKGDAMEGHMAAHLAEVRAALGDVFTETNGDAVHERWCECLLALVQGVMQVAKRYHPRGVAWAEGGAIPGDVALRAYSCPSLEPKETADRLAFDQALEALAAGSIPSLSAESFAVRRELGRGAFGQVFLAQGDGESLVAVKRLEKVRMFRRAYAFGLQCATFCRHSSWILRAWWRH